MILLQGANSVSFRNRSIVVATILLLGLITYAAAKYYAPSLVLYVVEQTLIQKAPEGSNPALLRERLHSLLAEITDENEKMARLLRISEQLEKVQILKPEDLDNLLAVEKH